MNNETQDVVWRSFFYIEQRCMLSAVTFAAFVLCGD